MWRFELFFLRLVDYVITLPKRLLRWFSRLLWLTPFRGKHKILRWFVGMFLLTIDLFPVPFLIETIMDLIKWKTRRLTDEEKKLIVGIYGDGWMVKLMGVDPASWIARWRRITYVTFYTINFDKKSAPNTFIHEAMHVWQYRNFGSLYVSEALWAQNWGGGYKYGGKAALEENKSVGLTAFNYEQQADIIEDYWRLTNGMPMQWTKAEDGKVNLFTPYIKELDR